MSPTTTNHIVYFVKIFGVKKHPLKYFSPEFSKEWNGTANNQEKLNSTSKLCTVTMPQTEAIEY